MYAAVTDETGRTQVIEKEVPKLEPHGVRVRMMAAGICGTDRHIVQREFPAALPRVLGHEMVGIVEAEAEPSNLSGKRVVVDPNLPCFACSECRAGRVHLCRHRKAIGIDWDGGFQEYVLVPQSQIYELAANVAAEIGVLAEPLSCCLHGLDRLAIQADSRVAVVGLGPIGTMLALILKSWGVQETICLEKSAVRRDAAKALGLDAREWEDAPNTFDIVVDAVGSGSIMEWAQDALRRGGQLLVFGVAKPQEIARIRPYTLYEKELSMVSAFTNPFTMQRAVNMINSGILPLDALLTDRIAIHEVPEALSGVPQGFKTFIGYEGGE